MKVNSFYPVIMTKNVEECSEFFINNLEFETTFSSEWYISLIDKYDNEVAFLESSHTTIPEGFRNQVRGLLLNFEVDNVDKIYKKLKESLEDRIVLDIRDEEFGQRHFIVEGPEKILIDIIQVIEPTDEFKDNYEQKWVSYKKNKTRNY